MRSKGFVPLTVNLTPSQKTALEDAAKESDLSVSAYVRRLLAVDKTCKERKKQILREGKEK